MRVLFGILAVGIVTLVLLSLCKTASNNWTTFNDDEEEWIKDAIKRHEREGE